MLCMKNPDAKLTFYIITSHSPNDVGMLTKIFNDIIQSEAFYFTSFECR